MNRVQKIMAVASCLLALGGMSMGFASEALAKEGPLDSFEINQEKMRYPSMLRMMGEITAIEDDKVIIQGEGQESVAALVNKDTYIIEGEQGKLRMARALKVGQKVMVYYSARMTRSLPPQAQAYALVIGDVRKEFLPQYFVVDQVRLTGNKLAIRVLNTTQSVIATIDGNSCAEYASIKPGDKLLIWSTIMTMSLPGQTFAQKAVILP